MLVLKLIPIYLTANIHCYGMCGPLMLLMSKQPNNHLYLLGRIVSYSLVGFLSSIIGQIPLEPLSSTALPFTYWILILWIMVKLYHIASYFTGGSNPKKASGWKKFFIRKVSPLSRFLVAMSAEKSRSALFLMGFSSVLIPCGQTLFVFSLCALHAQPAQGALAGFLLAFISTPALAFNLRFFQQSKMRGNRYLDEAAQLISLLLAFWLLENR